jgi:putative IMPACT (imprinted ancient) family translation regulator
LGIPGLINAYKTAASLALQLTPLIRKQVEVNYRLSFDYTVINDIMTIIKQNHCSIITQDLQLFCTMMIGVPMKNQEVVLTRLKEIPGLDWKKAE